MEGAGSPNPGPLLTGKVHSGQVPTFLYTLVSLARYIPEFSKALCVALTSPSLWVGVDSHPEELSLPVPTPDRTTSRTSSLSSDSSNLRSPNPSEGGADTPLAQSDEEDGGDGGAEPGPCS